VAVGEGERSGGSERLGLSRVRGVGLDSVLHDAGLRYQSDFMVLFFARTDQMWEINNLMSPPPLLFADKHRYPSTLSIADQMFIRWYDRVVVILATARCGDAS
jgi:hypothetical protein